MISYTVSHLPSHLPVHLRSTVSAWVSGHVVPSVVTSVDNTIRVNGDNRFALKLADFVCSEKLRTTSRRSAPLEQQPQQPNLRGFASSTSGDLLGPAPSGRLYPANAEEFRIGGEL